MKKPPGKKKQFDDVDNITPTHFPFHSFPTQHNQSKFRFRFSIKPQYPTNQNKAMKNQKKHKQKLKHIKPAKVVIWGMSTQTPPHEEEEEGGVCPGARMDSGMAAGTTRHPHHDMPNRVIALEEEEEEEEEVTSEDEHEYPSQEVMGGGCLEGGDGDMDDTVANGRERLNRHRTEVAGRVWIPEMWGQEEFLKDWVDCTVFDSSLVPSKIMSARAALVEEGRRASSPGLRVGNRC